MYELVCRLYLSLRVNHQRPSIAAEQHDTVFNTTPDVGEGGIERMCCERGDERGNRREGRVMREVMTGCDVRGCVVRGKIDRE